MNQLKFALGFLPLIVFSLVAQRLAADGVAWSATLAVAMSLIALLVAQRRGGPRLMNLYSLVLFGVVAVVGFVGDQAVDLWLYQWGRPLVTVLLGLVVVATVPLMPFTEEYARQTVPRQYWGSPTFRKINRTLSAAWGAAIVGIGLAGLTVTVLDAQADSPTDNGILDLILNWVVPIAVVWFMIRFTVRYPDTVNAEPQTA